MYKAAQGTVEVRLDSGITKTYRVPRSRREAQLLPDAGEWDESDRIALDVILHSGNELVRECDMRAAGIIVAPTLTQRKIKVDPGTGQVIKKASQHCVDNVRLQRIVARRNPDEPAISAKANCSSPVCDELTLNFALADMALRDRDAAKLDVPGAYGKGTRLRTMGAMALPEGQEQYDADGERLCIGLYTPMWGEEPAGCEWFVPLREAVDLSLLHICRCR